MAGAVTHSRIAMRKRYIQHPQTLELIPADEYVPPCRDAGFYVVPDIQPYRSMVTGELIGGRRQHREHLSAHGVVEVGNAFDNATPKPLTLPGGLKEKIAREVYSKLRY